MNQECHFEWKCCYVAYLCAEGEIIAQIWHSVLQQEDQALVEGVILTLHVCVSAQ